MDTPFNDDSAALEGVQFEGLDAKGAAVTSFVGVGSSTNGQFSFSLLLQSLDLVGHYMWLSNQSNVTKHTWVWHKQRSPTEDECQLVLGAGRPPTSNTLLTWVLAVLVLALAILSVLLCFKNRKLAKREAQQLRLHLMAENPDPEGST